MESPEQYIKTTRYRDFDQWSLFFSNKHGLSVEEIEQIVTEFVTKKKINQTGNQNGICFINLFSYEDAVKCFEGLQGHELIQLKRQNKDRGEPRRNNIKNEDVNKSDNNYDNMYASDVKNNGTHKNDSQDGEIKSNGKESVICDYPDNSEKSPQEYNELITDLKAKKVIDSNTYTYLALQFPEKPHAEVEPKMPELVLKKNTSDKVVPKGTTMATTTTTDIIHSVDKNAKLIEHVEAEELIIANIHEDYGTNYILHLLEKYQPICASIMKISEHYALRYCHVYFTSNQHINEVQKKFDSYALGTKNLIVLHANRL